MYATEPARTRPFALGSILYQEPPPNTVDQLHFRPQDTLEHDFCTLREESISQQTLDGFVFRYPRGPGRVGGLSFDDGFTCSS